MPRAILRAVPTKPKWGTTPRKSVEAACDRFGKARVVSGCRALLAGDKADPGLILALGGRPARWAAGFDEPAGPEYWLRVWGARGLLYAWDDEATPSILTALTDDAWRVREMAMRVVIKHKIREALPKVETLRRDSNARVRTAAERAALQLGRVE
jgi:HEAT repeat protein